MSDAIAITAVVIALGAAIFSGLAWNEARKANIIAAEANDHSAKANAISESNAALANEINDVSWDWEWDGPGRIRVANTGQHEARNIRVRLVCNGEIQTAAHESVPGGESFVFDFPEAAKEDSDYDQALAEHEESLSRPYSLGLMPPLEPIHAVSGRVTWSSPVSPGLPDRIER